MSGSGQGANVCNATLGWAVAVHGRFLGLDPEDPTSIPLERGNLNSSSHLPVGIRHLNIGSLLLYFVIIIIVLREAVIREKKDFL